MNNTSLQSVNPLLFGKCLLKQIQLFKETNQHQQHLLFTKYSNLPIAHPPSCCLDRINNEKNVEFAAVGVVVDMNGNALLTRRTKHLKMFNREWVFPGGRLDKDETFEEGMLREIYEEVGIELVYDSNKNVYLYKGNVECVVAPILMYESFYPEPQFIKYHTLIIMFKVLVPVCYEDIAVEIQVNEVDAYAWVDIGLLYNMLYNECFVCERKIEGYVYDDEKGIRKCEFTKDNFCSHYTSNGVFKKRETNKEYIPHGHQTAIKILFNTK